MCSDHSAQDAMFRLSRWLASSTDVLRMAARLRSEGRLPASTSIWAVENSLTNHPSRFEAKVGPPQLMIKRLHLFSCGK